MHCAYCIEKTKRMQPHNCICLVGSWLAVLWSTAIFPGPWIVWSTMVLLNCSRFTVSCPFTYQLSFCSISVKMCHWGFFFQLYWKLISFRARSTSPWIWDPRRPELCAAGSTSMKRVCAPRNSRGKTSSTPSANLQLKLRGFFYWQNKIRVKDQNCLFLFFIYLFFGSSASLRPPDVYHFA